MERAPGVGVELSLQTKRKVVATRNCHDLLTAEDEDPARNVWGPWEVPETIKGEAEGEKGFGWKESREPPNSSFV